MRARSSTPSSRPPEGRGRPATVWSLTSLADNLFPDRHADLTVSLIRSLRDVLGDEGLREVIDARGDEQVRAYTARVGRGSVRRRVEALARQRTDEGWPAHRPHTVGRQ